MIIMPFHLLNSALDLLTKDLLLLSRWSGSFAFCKLNLRAVHGRCDVLEWLFPMSFYHGWRAKSVLRWKPFSHSKCLCRATRKKFYLSGAGFALAWLTKIMACWNFSFSAKFFLRVAHRRYATLEWFFLVLQQILPSRGFLEF